MKVVNIHHYEMPKNDDLLLKFLFSVAVPFSVARCVMEKSPHSMLVGSGAQEFAVRNGFPVESNTALQTQESRKAFEVISIWCIFMHVASTVLTQKPPCTTNNKTCRNNVLLNRFYLNGHASGTYTHRLKIEPRTIV